MNKLLPSNHLLLASSQRVLALILEEIAIDHSDKSYGRNLLLRAEELHLSALNLAIRSFGEMNVQTAKHYGNLGRLYQSMEKFQEAQDMHLKAIKIKGKILRDPFLKFCALFKSIHTTLLAHHNIEYMFDFQKIYLVETTTKLHYPSGI